MKKQKVWGESDEEMKKRQMAIRQTNTMIDYTYIHMDKHTHTHKHSQAHTKGYKHTMQCNLHIQCINPNIHTWTWT